MTKNLPTPTADEINEAHQFAKESAEMAVDHAIRCGQLLAAKKASLPRGEFDEWVKENCDFGRATAYNYMKHSKSSNALDGSAIRHLFPSGQPGHKSKPTNTPKEAVSVVNPPGDGQDGTEETSDDRPAVSATKPPPGRGAPPLGAVIEDEPERPEWEPDEDAALEAADRDYQERIDKAMASDDALAEAFAQIKQQSALIATLTQARDSYMNSQGEAVRQLKRERNKVARLEKEIERLRGVTA
jgi:hypothetical protein